ncbi:type III-A CRISPR-associated protein Csm2 [Clostridiaceae bacterium UIB06]|uniref:CRISPR system Cms protein Csm2 n=1 Tax=Clostridium thailandense TaxID=2794346 RepID=A0A949U0J9_9CLOT|nr:type III-A CRISPR-associated protein Csm2 [Clostridium thailandense]MBV7275125.1 type III-A CRISPR-associated protein Csm2 [Clostridium thailandense]MCH5136918.1 type III-A CRISPR-associated protein Csm2 [Clostridiaceae bacterium UIB06]
MYNNEKYFSEIILRITSLTDEYDSYIYKCKKYAEYLRNEKLTTSQIRKIYSDIMNAKTAMDLKRLRPRLAYIRGKSENSRAKYAIRSLIDILDKGIESLNVNDNEEEIKSLKEFIETIVAYRKYYGDNT